MRHSRFRTYVANDSEEKMRHSRSMTNEFNLVEGFHTENSVSLDGVPIAGMFAEVFDLSSIGVSCS